MINNTAWLAGYAAFEAGDGIPWGDESARRGWLTARADAENDGATDSATDHG